MAKYRISNSDYGSVCIIRVQIRSIFGWFTVWERRHDYEDTDCALRCAEAIKEALEAPLTVI